MKKVNTVFQIGDQNYTVEGAGQETCSAILKEFPGQVIIIKGFLIDGEFKPLNF